MDVQRTNKMSKIFVDAKTELGDVDTMFLQLRNPTVKCTFCEHAFTAFLYQNKINKNLWKQSYMEFFYLTDLLFYIYIICLYFFYFTN